MKPMLTARTHQNTVWADLVDPTTEDLESLVSEYGVHPFAAETLLSVSPKPGVALYDNFIRASFHFPASEENMTSTPDEIGFLVGEKLVASVRRGPRDPFHELVKSLEMSDLLEREVVGTHAGHLFVSIMRHLYSVADARIARLEQHLRDIEKDIFSGKEKEMVFELSKASGEILALRAAFRFHKEALVDYEEAARAFFGPDYRVYAATLQGDWERLRVALGNARNFLSELRTTNHSLLTTKQNEVMQLFTIAAFITFPLVLLAQLLAINTPSNPIMANQNAFWIITGIVVALALVMLLHFRRKGWL